MQITPEGGGTWFHCVKNSTVGGNGTACRSEPHSRWPGGGRYSPGRLGIERV